MVTLSQDSVQWAHHHLGDVALHTEAGEHQKATTRALVDPLHANVCLLVSRCCSQEYFKAAAKYLNDAAQQGQDVTDISGVWLSSDDGSILAEVGVGQKQKQKQKKKPRRFLPDPLSPRATRENRFGAHHSLGEVFYQGVRPVAAGAERELQSFV